MNWLDRLERKMGRHYIPGLIKYVVFGMLLVFAMDYLLYTRGASASEMLYFSRPLILQGQVWRLLTFIFLPPSNSFFWILLSLYFYFFLGTSLENHWGSARFNIYYALGVVGCILSGLLTGYTTNEFLNDSLLLAFAVLYPEMEFMLFFVLPVKVKWLGWATGALLIYQFIVVPFAYKVGLVLSLLPFVVFFGKQAWLQLRMDVRRLLRWFRTRT